MFHGLLKRLRLMRRSRTRRGAKQVRVEICPPLLHADRPSWQQRFWRWLKVGSPDAAATTYSDPASLPDGATPLAAVRVEFIECLADVRTQQAGDLIERIRRARSLRELWHLRSDVFSAVSRRHDQSVARSRMVHLNRHFPTRETVSAFGSFDSLLADLGDKSA